MLLFYSYSLDDDGLYADDGEDRWDSSFYSENNRFTRKNALKRTREKKNDDNVDEDEEAEKKPRARPLEKLFNKSFKASQKQSATNFAKSLNIEGDADLKDLLMNPLSGNGLFIYLFILFYFILFYFLLLLLCFALLYFSF